MSTIRNGDLAIYRGGMTGEPERIAIEGGFAEVNDRGLTVLAERADVAA
jgi:F-type H+-transporting ATPase subunit epsilon